MKWLKWIVGLFLLFSLGGLSTGCQTQGHRKFTLTVLGTEFSVEDQAYADNTGDQKYEAGFTDSWTRPLLEWLFKPKTDNGSDTGSEPSNPADGGAGGS